LDSTPPAAPEEKQADASQRQAQDAQLEQRVNDPEWRPLAEHVQKKLGEQFTFHWGEVHHLIYGTWNPCPLPFLVTYTVPELLAVLSRCGPRGARRRLDEVLEGRREKRRRPTAERNATWQRWHEEEGIGSVKIARRWKEETGEVVEHNTVKQAIRRSSRTG
jgi:hypothetical protein